MSIFGHLSGRWEEKWGKMYKKMREKLPERYNWLLEVKMGRIISKKKPSNWRAFIVLAGIKPVLRTVVESREAKLPSE
jgi:hypothetical protein